VGAAVVIGDDVGVAGGGADGQDDGLGKGLVGAGADPAIVEVIDGKQVAQMGGGLEGQGAAVYAGGFEFVDGAGLKGEGDGAGEVEGGVFKVLVDEERDGDDAGGAGFGEVAGPLVDGDGAGDVLRRFGRGAAPGLRGAEDGGEHGDGGEEANGERADVVERRDLRHTWSGGATNAAGERYGA